MRQLRGILLVALYVMLYSAVFGFAQPRYTVTDLGGQFFPYSLTPGGIVCGYALDATGNGRPAVLVNGQLLTLPVYGWANGCNDAAQVVGGADDPSQDGLQAFLWDASGFRWLVGPKGEINSEATGINAAGEISIHYYTPLPNGTFRRVSARIEGNTWVPLPSLGGGYYFDRAQGINDYGDVVMDSEGIIGGQYGWHATIATDQGALIDLGTLGSPGVQAINNAQQVTGNTVGGGFLAQSGQVLTLLPPMGGFPVSMAADIDDDGTVVGSSIDSRPTVTVAVATLWAPGQPPINLNTLIDPTSGWELTSASAIRQGSVVGLGRLHGQRRAYLLTPIPAEPSLAIRLNQPTFQPGQTLRVTIDLSNPGPILTTDVYVGVILPDGVNTLFLTNVSPLEGVMTTLSSDPSTFARLLRNVSWPAGMRATQQDYFTHTFTGLESSGTYHVLVGWTKPNSLEDGRIDEGDVLALAWAPFSFTRGSTPALYATMRAIQAKHRK
jgi:uncharacterized repeat protein (TIGR01451 family)